MERQDGRRPDQLRPVRIVPGYLPHAEGSALIEQGGTVVLCAVSVEDRLPAFLRDKGGSGWVTAEYGMLPRSTHTRSPREAALGRVGGRTHEIQRLIGRALRAVTRLDILGERTFTVDCDVIQADAGTRCAAITGAYVALRQACELLLARRSISTMPLRDALAAVSVGIVEGVPLLDLTYEEDSRADADFNVVLTASGEFVEVQGSAESAPFPRATLDEVLRLAGKGIGELLEAQKEAFATLDQLPSSD
jgi:ribonuclease PH